MNTVSTTIFNSTTSSKMITGMMEDILRPLSNNIRYDVGASFKRLHLSAWLVFSLILIQAVGFGYAVPISSPAFQATIQNPCGRNLNSQGQAHTALSETIKSNRAVARGAKEDVQTLKDLYKDNLSSRNVRRYSNTSKYRLRGLQTDSNTSPADSDPGTTWTDTSNQVDAFTKHHYDTSLLILYIRQAIDEQNRYEGGYLVPQLQDVENALLNGVLCAQDTALRQMGHPVTSSAEDSDLPAQFRNQRLRTRRYTRDFIVANNVQKQLSLMEDYYDRLFGILTADETQQS